MIGTDTLTATQPITVTETDTITATEGITLIVTGGATAPTETLLSVGFDYDSLVLTQQDRVPGIYTLIDPNGSASGDSYL